MVIEKVVLSARLEPQYIQSLDEVAKSRKISRSKLLRELAMNASIFYDFLMTEKERQQNEKIRLDGNLSRWVLEHNPEMPADFLHFLGGVLHHAAQIKEQQEKGEPAP